MSVLTTDSIKMNQATLNATGESLIRSCAYVSQRTYSLQIVNQLLQIAASQYTFSATALHSLVIILQDSRYTSLLDDLEDGAIAAFLASAALVLNEKASDSHVYFRTHFNLFAPILATRKLSLVAFNCFLDCCLSMVRQQKTQIDFLLYKQLMVQSLDQSTYFTLRGSKLIQLINSLDKSASRAALLFPVELINSKIVSVRLTAFLVLMDLAANPQLGQIASALVKLATDAFLQTQIVDYITTHAVFSKLPQVAFYSKSVAQQLFKMYFKYIGAEDVFNPGKEYAEKIQTAVANT